MELLKKFDKSYRIKEVSSSQVFKIQNGSVMIILNLGCGTKTSNNPEVINVDWSIYLRLKQLKVLALVIPLFIRGERLERFNSIPDNILVHNLIKGIPFSSDSVDVVYHSHILEHLDRNVAEKFLMEAKRVLKPGGIHRVVVPDFEATCRAYIEHISSCEKNPSEFAYHDSYIATLLEMSVRKDAYGTSQQKPYRRFFENLFLGDARQRGETHQWMYDRINLKSKFINVGYKNVIVQQFNTSLVLDWSNYGLDVDDDSNQYKPDSLYMEAVK